MKCPFCGRFMRWKYDRWSCYYNKGNPLDQHGVVEENKK